MKHRRDYTRFQTGDRRLEAAMAGIPDRVPVYAQLHEFARQELGISVSYWSTLEAIQAWKENTAHRRAQGRAREWYQAFRVRVCRVEREYGFTIAG